MQIINNFSKFIIAYEKRSIANLERRQNRKLFGFILFDDRASHQAVQDFVADEYHWLDKLAASANMVCFVCLDQDSESGDISNPSLKVASLFGIRPNQLPGIVLFTELVESGSEGELGDSARIPMPPPSPEPMRSIPPPLTIARPMAGGDTLTPFTRYRRINRGVFIPLAVELFEQDTRTIEKFFADLFSVIQAAQVATATQGHLIEKLKGDVASLSRRKKLRKFIQYLRGPLAEIIKMPERILESIGKELGKELGRKL